MQITDYLDMILVNLELKESDNAAQNVLYRRTVFA